MCDKYKPVWKLWNQFSNSFHDLMPLKVDMTIVTYNWIVGDVNNINKFEREQWKV